MPIYEYYCEVCNSNFEVSVNRIMAGKTLNAENLKVTSFCQEFKNQMWVNKNIDKENNIKIEKNPFDLLEKWYKKAKRNEISNPNAMALSTVGPFNKPRTRMVLMKEIKENGIIFYTNSNSRKGNHINDNKNVKFF